MIYLGAGITTQFIMGERPTSTVLRWRRTTEQLSALLSGAAINQLQKNDPFKKFEDLRQLGAFMLPPEPRSANHA